MDGLICSVRVRVRVSTLCSQQKKSQRRIHTVGQQKRHGNKKQDNKHLRLTDGTSTKIFFYRGVKRGEKKKKG